MLMKCFTYEVGSIKLIYYDKRNFYNILVVCKFPDNVYHIVGGEVCIMEEESSYSILDIKEADPLLEKHRKDVLEKYLEYGLVLVKKFKNDGKTLDDLLEHIKTILWYVKDQRAREIEEEFGVKS